MNGTVDDDEAISAAARLLTDHLGLRVDSANRGRLSRFVVAEAESRGLSVPGYVTSLDIDHAAVQALIELITVQKTDFFRDPMQSEALVGLIPQLASPVTIWSAGCSNGQEPYSLAMVLAESGVADWRVIASDVSTAALERTRRARYSTGEMHGVTAVRRAQHFAQVGDDWEVLPSLSRRVEVVRHRLTAEAPPFAPGRCQVVFCRNVLIYVRPEDVRVFVERVARWLPPGGWLFLGYSESLWQVTDQFDLVRLGDAFVYRKRDAAKPAVAPAAMTPPARRSPTRATPTSTTAHAARKVKGKGLEARAGRARLAADRVAGTARATGSTPAPDGPPVTAPEPAASIPEFRRSVYLHPERPIPHLHLGIALEAAGELTASKRAYAAARLALGNCDPSNLEAELDGYEAGELVRMLDAKLGPS